MKFTVDYEVHGHFEVTVDADNERDAIHAANSLIYNKHFDVRELEADLYSAECNGETHYFA